MKNEQGVAMIFALILLSVVTIGFTSYLNWYQHQYSQYHSASLYYQRMANGLLRNQELDDYVSDENKAHHFKLLTIENDRKYYSIE